MNLIRLLFSIKGIKKDTNIYKSLICIGFLVELWEPKIGI